MNKFEQVLNFIREQFPGNDFIPLHEPVFKGSEKTYVLEAIESTFVSSVGEYVDRFESEITKYTGAKYAVATVNGTSALHIALKLVGVKSDEEVLTQALTFVATSNAIRYTGANPVYIDVEKNTLGLSPEKLNRFLRKNATKKNDNTYNKKTGNRLAACLPMHTFGFPCRVDEIVKICNEWNIPVVEDAAESMGSFYKGKHTGTFGNVGIISFNGNKIITCGGGGVVITDDENIARTGKHLITQAKVDHKWEYFHNHVGYNYRLPNLNAALACAQLEQIDGFIKNKRNLASTYEDFFKKTNHRFVTEPENSIANYWLNTVVLENREERDEFLKLSNENRVMTRPAWTLMNKLPMFSNCQHDDLEVSHWLEDRIVNIPSSVR